MELEIINYIKNAKGHGLNETEIKQNLLNAGWEAAVVEECLIHAKALENQTTAAKPEPRIEPFKKPLETIAPQTAHANIAISQETFEQSPGKRFFKKPVFWISLTIFLIILAGGGYWYYAYGSFYTPTKVWNKFIKNEKNLIYENTFSASYTDLLNEEDKKKLGSLNLQDIKLDLKGKMYVNAVDPKNPESSAETKFSFGSGNTDFTTGYEYRLINKILYLNAGNNPFISSIIGAMAKDKKIDWIKIDLNAIEDEINKQSQSEEFGLEFTKIFNNSLKSELSKIWEDATFVKIEKYLGREKIENTPTFHFKNNLDKQAIKNAFENALNKIVQSVNQNAASEDKKIKDSDVSTAKAIANALVDKIQIQDFETWIGTRDFRLYKVKLTSNSPSFLSAVSDLDSVNPLESARSKSRDAKRLADIRQYASALELYFNDMNGYPEGKNGKAIDISPNYISIIPEAPLPSDGSCSDYYNAYWYEPKGKKTTNNGKSVYESYELTFCLGDVVGGYQPGFAKLTPAGIQGGIACPGTAQQCAPTNNAQNQPSVEDKAKELVEKWSFSATINFESTYSNYGKKQQIQAPENAFDIIEVFKTTQSKSNDSKRLADMRMMASALELYFNDKNQYPQNLQLLTPSYISSIPSAPLPPDGNCSDEDNGYKYKFVNSNSYELNFCLGQETGGYQAGKHYLSPAGIQ